MSASASSSKTRTRQTRERSRRKIIEAATELVRERSYAELNVGEIMARAGLGRTIFYRHFDDLGDLLVRAGREAVDQLYEAQLKLASTRIDHGPGAVEQAIRLPVEVYHRHGPLLRAIAEAGAADELVATGHAAILRRFDDLVATVLRNAEAETGPRFPDLGEAARALNRLNESYLLDAFGRERRVPVDTAVQTLTAVWVGALGVA
jgi:TetR/AcrR family transcriptional regulator, ethionamide resistance regulator